MTLSKPPVPLVQPLPPGLVTLDDHEAHARTQLDSNAWAYFSGGAADEITLHANRRAWNQLQLLPRVLRPLGSAHTQIQLLGRTLAHPLLVAPMAWQQMAHADGELAMAHAAAAQAAGLVLSTQASRPLTTVAQAFGAYPERGPLWFQLYMQADRGFTRELAQRARDAGYEALVLTVDAPVSGARDRERRAGFRLPPGVASVNLAGAPPSDAPLEAAATWADVEWLCSATQLPVILKGVLHPDDARQAAGLGVSAVVVSNHGGRVLDTVITTAQSLSGVVDAIGGDLPVLVDGGIRRGTDVFKALALGASAVMVGRPCLWGLANAGAVGVAHVLRLLRDEFEMAMLLCGCREPASISRSMVIANAMDSHL
ncbi:MAG: alpha-hydroxy-acid oxidizing protein [Ramlibacter sp.]|nr:alpha-hydroxy-acid oxidizing protein [Ramlibacter sp.]